jgi:small multidrug resistance pump
MYHFPTKDAMMVAVIEHVLARWQAELSATLTVPLARSTIAERVRAFVAFAGEGGATRGEFVVFAEAVRRPSLAAPWLEHLRRWFGFGEGHDEVTATLALRGAIENPWWALLAVAGYAGAFVALSVLLRLGASIGVMYGIWAAAGVVLTAVIASIIFGEQFTFLIALGIAIVIAGVVLVETGHGAAKPEAADADL